MEGAKKPPFDESGRLPAAQQKQKNERLQVRLEKIVRRQETLAKFQLEILDAIRKNPDFTIEDLAEEIKKLKAKAEISDEQELLAILLYQAYTERRKTLKNIRELVPTPEEQYKIFFGKDPLGKVEAIASPFLIYLRIHRYEDYIWAAAQKYDSNKAISEDEKERLMRYRALTLHGTLVRGMEGAIAIECAMGRKFDDQRKSTFHHEEQHSLDQLFKKLIQDQRENIRLHLDKAKRSLLRIIPQSEVDLLTLLEKLFPKTEHEFEQAARNEILAYLRQDRETSEIEKRLTKKKSEKGSYDFFTQRSRRYVKPSKKNGEDVAWDVISNKILSRSQYEHIVTRALRAVDTLKMCHYSHNEIVAILLGTPLRKWSGAADLFQRVYANRSQEKDERATPTA